MASTWAELCFFHGVPSLYCNRCTTWVFPKIGVPQNGWFIMENPINGWFGGTTIFGNIHLLWEYCKNKFVLWNSSGQRISSYPHTSPRSVARRFPGRMERKVVLLVDCPSSASYKAWNKTQLQQTKCDHVWLFFLASFQLRWTTPCLLSIHFSSGDLQKASPEFALLIPLSWSNPTGQLIILHFQCISAGSISFSRFTSWCCQLCLLFFSNELSSSEKKRKHVIVLGITA